MDGTKLRAWWWRRQGLDGSLLGKRPAEVLDRAGWARSVGGAGPYLTLFSRAGTSREAIDQAVANLEIHELPSARSCTYVLPAADFALGLVVGQSLAGSDFKTAEKLGVTDKEIEKLCDGVVGALQSGPLDPDAIREATGKLSRSLGEEGKKKGVTTTLPIALGRLQARGDIRRIPVNGRLDQQRYRYTLWTPSPLANYNANGSEAYLELARRFFRWIGPATATEFQGFSALGVKATREILEPLKLVPAEAGSDRLLLPEDADSFKRFKVPGKPQFALVSSLDSISILRRDIKTLVDPKDLEREVQLEKGASTIGAISDFPNHAILDRGRLVGLWEFDVESQSIVYATFGAINDKGLDEAVKRTEGFVRDELSDARSFSLDSPKSRRTRIAALREMKRF